MTTIDSIQAHSRGAEEPVNRVVYRELWKTAKGDINATVKVYWDGSVKIEGRNRVATGDVSHTLASEGLQFVRLVR